MKDAVIVGAGLAGLSAAWRLRHWDTVVLESGDRVGGRIRSEKRGQYFLNWGGHVFAGANSSTRELLQETGTRAVTVPGSLAGIAMNGKLLLKGKLQTYPFRIPMPMSSRAALMTAGAKVSLDVFRYAKVVKRRPGETGESRQQRIYDFENDRSFADYIGDLPEDAEALFRPTVTRSAADPEELSAGAGIGYFSLVWNVGEGLDQHIAGGPSTLTENIAASLRDRIELGASVQEVVHEKDHVVVRYRQDGVDHEVRARTVVLATPATVTHAVAVDLPAETREALSKIVYGPYVSAAFLTNETTAQPWDAAYGIATPKRSFNVALNMGNIARGSESSRQPGGSLMVFSPASLARDLLHRSDEEILDIYTRDLDEVLPGFGGIVEEAHVQRWETGAPYCFPGRGRLQAALTRPTDRVFLAGDYLGTLYTETAITSGFSAAQRAASALATERQTRGALKGADAR
ncbi:NAD(P)-binding protein [Rathayibacter sp. VKM Ac-2759]|uniref:protoporphyrinogen/coproporphyrinogen oxidase n=1 Tax=Rathayibacter sp. VKM Ac-2759 TaxID=2609252 RepID=UPI0013191068|nr:NAD(P)/FAD-dependent oxidoreductase [Rathayibacter sp. VKM Ac-2759]QHC68038.1 NAD(P)-binding protein [Rathayibacter sp. VKM Ac-2759]